MSEKQTKDYLLTLDEKLHASLKIRTAKLGMTMKDYITMALLEKLSKK